MIDPEIIDALEEAGFEKAMTEEEWLSYNANVIANRYGDSDVTVQYILTRGDVQITVEQNTQRQGNTAFGAPATVHFPEVVLVERGAQRVACPPDVRLILAMADELTGPLPNRALRRGPKGGPRAVESE